MTLEEQLDRLRAQSRTRFPPEVQAVMERAIEDVRRSGLMQRIPKVGDRAPDFTLPNARGESVRLADLLARGPVVVSFYRGRW